jgi:hypothetical protein
MLAGLAAGCSRAAPELVDQRDIGPVWFRDATREAGLDFRHEAGPVGRYFMPQIMGSGVALLDFDNDGRLDIYLINNGGPNSPARNRLFRQHEDGAFEDVSAGSGLDVNGHGMGVAVGDFDNDGYVDVYVSQYGGGRLFRNRGHDSSGKWLGFEELTQSAGVEQPRWGTSCCFVDYDRDGWLDLVVVNYVDYDPSQSCAHAGGQPDYCHPSKFPGTAARLFRNRGRGPDGRWLGFEDVTLSSGVARLPGAGLGVVCADFDGDGWPDIFVANDAHANHLWINQRDGTFREEAIPRGLAFSALGNAQGNMGVTLGDVNGNCRLDLFVSHLTEETHTLWMQTGTGLFRDRTAQAGLAATRWRGTGFGTILADFDNDGALDIAVVNGRVRRGPPLNEAELGPFWSRYAERNQLFANDGAGRFRDVSSRNDPFCAPGNVGRGLAWGVLDNQSGTVDLVVTTVAGPARLYRNAVEKRGHWLLVRAVDPRLKRDALGAIVTVQAGQRRWVGLVNPGQSYLSSGDPRVHFGLGVADRVDSVRVDWPDGLAEEFPGMPADRIATLHRGKGRKVGP